MKNFEEKRELARSLKDRFNASQDINERKDIVRKVEEIDTNVEITRENVTMFAEMSNFSVSVRLLAIDMKHKIRFYETFAKEGLDESILYGKATTEI